MNNKKSKICFIGKLAATAIFGTMLSAVPYFNRDINKVYAVGPGEEEEQEEFRGELDAAAVGILCSNFKFCNFVDNRTRILFIPDGFDSVASDAFDNLSYDIVGLVLPDDIINKVDWDKLSGLLRHVFICPNYNLIDASGNIDFAAYYTLYNNGRISDTLDSDFVRIFTNAPKYAPDGPDGTFIVPKCFRNIHPDAFRDCNFSKVEFNDNITELPENLFRGNQSLRDITLPKNCKKIGNSCFENCTNLFGEIIFPEGLESIGERAFINCHAVFSEFPNTVKYIGKAAFACGGNRFKNIPPNITSLNDYTFHRSNFDCDIVIPKSCVYVGNHCFDNSTIHGGSHSVKFPGAQDGSSNLQFLGERAFGNINIMPGNDPGPDFAPSLDQQIRNSFNRTGQPFLIPACTCVDSVFDPTNIWGPEIQKARPQPDFRFGGDPGRGEESCQIRYYNPIPMNYPFP